MNKLFLIGLATAAFAAPCAARDTVYRLPLAEVLAMPEAHGKLDGSVRFYLAGQTTPPVVDKKGEAQANRKTNGVGKGDTDGCKWAALSALIALQEQARGRGANAVVDMVSYYRKNVYTSATEYECHAGNIVIGVTLKGTYATVAPK
jgi:hypothetical protein